MALPWADVVRAMWSGPGEDTAWCLWSRKWQLDLAQHSAPSRERVVLTAGAVSG